MKKENNLFFFNWIQAYEVKIFSFWIHIYLWCSWLIFIPDSQNQKSLRLLSFALTALVVMLLLLICKASYFRIFFFNFIEMQASASSSLHNKLRTFCYLEITKIFKTAAAEQCFSSFWGRWLGFKKSYLPNIWKSGVNSRWILTANFHTYNQGTLKNKKWSNYYSVYWWFQCFSTECGEKSGY